MKDILSCKYLEKYSDLYSRNYQNNHSNINLFKYCLIMETTEKDDPVIPKTL